MSLSIRSLNGLFDSGFVAVRKEAIPDNGMISAGDETVSYSVSLETYGGSGDVLMSLDRAEKVETGVIEICIPPDDAITLATHILTFAVESKRIAAAARFRSAAK